MNKLENKVALVTGAGRGIGRAIALAIANEGSNVVVNDINFDAACKVAEEIEALGRDAMPFKADISDYEEDEAKVVEIETQKKHDENRPHADIPGLISHQGPHNMSSIQLTHRKQVEGCYEYPNPSCKKSWMCCEIGLHWDQAVQTY